MACPSMGRCRKREVSLVARHEELTFVRVGGSSETAFSKTFGRRKAFATSGGVWLMKNGNLEQFLDTGWYMEAELYYRGYVYWCEGCTDRKTQETTFFVDCWRADCEDGKWYREYRDEANRLLDCHRAYEDTDKDMDLLKKRFLQAPIFNGKSFWQVEEDIIWVDPGEPIRIHNHA